MGAELALAGARLGRMKQPQIRDFRAVSHSWFRVPRRPGSPGRAFKGIRISLPLAAVVLAALLVWSLHDVSLFRVLNPNTTPVIVLEAADGQELGRRGPLRGVPVSRKDLPPHLVNAVLAIEDRRFYSHWGVDPKGILRAFARNLKAGEVREGGSTITQQLARTLLGEDDRTIRRKIREAVLAGVIEGYFSKDEILTLYLNSIYFGAGVTGVSGAAQVYFDKQVSELSLQEAALIAGLIQAPSQLNPLRNLKAARERAGVVLDAMVDSGTLGRAAALKAKANPARLKPGRPPSTTGSWFADWAHGEALKLLGTLDDKSAAVRVRTTLEPEIQALAERVVSGILRRQGKDSGVSQAALVAMRPNGEVVAMVGGRDYEASQFNRATQALRQPGSTFKLFVYFAALRNGYSLHDTIEDAPIQIQKWRPKNFDGRYLGEVTIAEAFARSLNVATVRLAQAIGIDNVVEAARMLGIDAPLKATPSLALGSSEVSLADLTGAYASVRAGIAPTEPRAIAEMEALDRLRPIPFNENAKPTKSLAEQWQLIALLREAVEHGTGQAARLDGFTAGKTGTTENHRDAWFVGFNDGLVTGVWVGNDDNSPTAKVTGGKLPAAMWKEFMAGASKLLRKEMPIVEAGPEIVGGVGPEPVREAEETVRPAEALIAGAFGQSDREEGLTAMPLRCDYEACARAYRSFRASDCTFQPYRGERKFCVRGDGGYIGPEDDFADQLEFAGDITADDDDETIEDDFEDAEAMNCNYDACERTYRSFRASDCTYQPYRGGRRLCVIDADPWDAPGDEDFYDDSDDPYRDSGFDYE